MFKKVISLIVVIVMIAGLAAGCQSGGDTQKPVDTQPSGDDANTSGEDQKVPADEPSDSETLSNEDGVLVWNLRTDQNSWDPPFIYTVLGAHLGENIYEGLLQSTKEGMMPAAAESYDVSEDLMTYTFHLREGMKWSDGQPLTAHDFEYSWKRVCDPSLASEYSYILYPYIKGGTEFMEGKGSKDDIGVKALDDLTLEVQLTSPVPYFPDLAAFTVYKPVREDIVEKYGEGWEKNPETCVTNGPFKVTEYQMGSHMILEKNENYWDADSVKIPKIRVIFLAEDTTALNAYEAGEIQVLESVPTDEIARLKMEDPNFGTAYKASTPHLIFNVDVPPVDNVNVRKALTLAVDRVKLTEQVLKGGQIPATGIIPPHFTYSDGSSCRQLDADGNPLPEFYIDPFDSEKNITLAKELLAEAGYPDGQGFPEITFTTSNTETGKKRAEAIIEMLKTNLNIEVKINLVDAATSGDAAKRGHHIVGMGGFGADYIDPVAMLDCFMSTSVNNNCLWRWQPLDLIPEDKIMNPENKDFDDAINASMFASGKERDDLLREAERILIDNGVVGPLYYDVTTEIIDQAVVKGVTRNKSGSFLFKNAEFVD